MSIRHRSSILLPFFSLLTLVALLLAACGGETGPTGSGTTPSSSTPSSTPTKIALGLGYVPDVQFSPFYVAKSKGYYSAAGLDVTFNHGIVPDMVGSMIAGKNNFVFVSGDEMLIARDKKINVLNVATVFQKYPVSLIVPENSPIKTLADLKGHTVGVPGPFGATYTGLLALLYKANMTLSDIKMQSIQFTQVAALSSGKVDAVMGYSNNEPLQLKNKGFAVRTFEVSDYQPLISNGIVTTEETYNSKPEMVRAFVQATLKGLEDVIADPENAVELSKSFIPGLTDTKQALEVLKATIPIWQGSGKLGYNDPATWASMEQFLLDQKMISQKADLAKAYTNDTLG